MNWLINIVIFQLLLGQAISDLSCMESKKCSCSRHAEKDEIQVTCNSSTTTVNSMDSIIEIDCKSDQIQWEKLFDHINLTQLYYKNCILDTGIHQTISEFGIDEIRSIKMINMKLNSSRLKNVYFSNLESVDHLDITNTKLVLTNESFEGTPNLTKLFLRQNFIEEIPKGVFKFLTHLIMLDLGGNKITKIETDVFDSIPLKSLILDSNYLTTLSLNIPSLKRLDVSNNGLTSITVNNLNKLVELSLNKNILITMPDQPFKNTSLESIKYNDGNFTNIPDQFLTKLERLLKVHLKSLNLEKLPENMIWNSANITELSLASNRLKELPVLFFRDSEKMKVLDLSKNQIEKIDYDLMKPLINLEILDLSSNLIVQINKYGLRLGSYLGNLVNLNLEKNSIVHIEREALNIPKLKHFKLAHNKISKLFSNYSFSLHYLSSVEDIDLSNNRITSIDSDWMTLIKLKNVNLAYNNFTILEAKDFQFLNENVKFNLNYNPLQEVDLNGLVSFIKAQPSERLLHNTKKITLSGNKLICDCRNYEFAMYIKNQMPKAVYKYINIEQDLICTNGTEFSNINAESLTCDWKLFYDLNKVDCLDSECACAYRPHDRSAIMNCSDRNLTSAPNIIISSKHINYTELNLRNNFITRLPNYEHSNIRKLNVGYNNLIDINITQLPKNIIVSLYN